MSHEERITDMPAPLRWFLIAFKNVGFPVIVCVWLAYQQFVDGQEQRKALGEFKEVVMSLKTSIDYQTKLMKRKNFDD